MLIFLVSPVSTQTKKQKLSPLNSHGYIAIVVVVAAVGVVIVVVVVVCYIHEPCLDESSSISAHGCCCCCYWRHLEGTKGGSRTMRVVDII